MSRDHVRRLGLMLGLMGSLGLIAMSCRDTRDRPDGGTPDGDADADSDSDSDSDSDRPDWDGAPLDPCGRSACGEVELCGSDGRGDGLDNDCDGTVDEDCVCQPMTDSMSCFPAPPDRQNIGACSDGVQTCSEFGIWNSCVGAVVPTDEVCDGMDNDCDGSVDEDLRSCDSAIVCPSGQATASLSTFPLNGSAIFSGPTRSWHWEIECPPTVPAGSCPQPANPNQQNTEVYFVASGTYRVHVTIVASDGETFECSFAVWVRGAGLRVELNWDTQGSGRGDTDVDLHLHQSSTRGDFFTGEDCYYMNCKASSYGLDWGLTPTADVSSCEDAPHGEGDTWRSLGVCYNPRLDVDVIYCDPSVTDASDGSFCSPENINVDNPPPGQPFRVMVNYYSDHGYMGDTHPSVNIYCGGDLRASFGTRGEVVLRNGSGSQESNDNWMVADVRFYTDDCGSLTCEVAPLDRVTNTADFGPPWSW
jgi:hypothetical protein